MGCCGRGKGGVAVGPRRVLVGDAEGTEAANPAAVPTDNVVVTSKYNIITFLPINMMEQFSRPANVYFLLIAVLASFPAISPIGPASSIAPLVFVLTVTAFKDALEDWAKHKSDRELNNRPVQVFRPHEQVPEARKGIMEGWVKTIWADVACGDLVLVERDRSIPADLFILAVSDDKGLAFVETKDLDGETNLKRKEVPRQFRGLSIHDAVKHAKADGIVCRQPNPDLKTFNATYHVGDPSCQGDGVGVSISNLLLRECVLRKTDWVVGVACYTGRDSKIVQQNSGKGVSVRKLGRLDRMMNFVVLGVFCYLMLVVTICTIGGAIFAYNEASGQWYTKYTETTGKGFLRFLTYIIVFNAMIPISLYVSLEIVRIFHAKFIDWDYAMYYKKLDIPAVTKNSGLCDEIGQIEYIFSDKTGTLTRNQMDFMKAVIAGQSYGKGLTEIAKGELKMRNQPIPPDPPFPEGVKAEPGFNFRDERLMFGNWAHTPRPELAQQYMYLLALCNEVTLEDDKENPGRKLYESPSPDEIALVKASKNFGFTLRYVGNIEGQEAMVKTLYVADGHASGRQEDWIIHEIFEFTSDRKRQSVIAESPEGKMFMYCKGADSVVERLLSPQSEFLQDTKNEVDVYAREGLRTLLCAYKELPRNEWERLSADLAAARRQLEDRDEHVARALEPHERNFLLLGATAIEDKLQKGVPDAVAHLMAANLKIWVLTGDKWDTAINIGSACSLLTSEMRLAKIKMIDEQDPIRAGKSEDEIESMENDHVKSRMEEELQSALNNPDEPYAVVIDGESLIHALQGSIRPIFRQLGMGSKAVVCCRVSPDQKAQVVRLVNDAVGSSAVSKKGSGKQKKKFVTLAIGDGANDVKMIKSANIGVGIKGEEGVQAANSSDFSIGQFRFLSRLLLIHGRVNYIRVASFIGYFFFKNMTLAMTEFWFAGFNQFYGSVLHEAWHTSLFNVVFTSFPVLIMAIFDTDMRHKEDIYSHPDLYRAGQENRYFKVSAFLSWVAEAIYASLVCGFVYMFCCGVLSSSSCAQTVPKRSVFTW